ncbi:MAG: hypothetical protein MJ078_06255 [Clostridia bacterium]|nr:hypothetical protein [Clostridia bacterium]
MNTGTNPPDLFFRKSTQTPDLSRHPANTPQTMIDFTNLTPKQKHFYDTTRRVVTGCKFFKKDPALPDAEFFSKKGFTCAYYTDATLGYDTGTLCGKYRKKE